MKIRDIRIEDVVAGKNWRGCSDSEYEDLADMEIDEFSSLREDETVVYSALAVVPSTGEVRPLLLVREVGTYEWWGDTIVYANGAWSEMQQEPQGSGWIGAESYVAAPLRNDPSFMGEYSPDHQRAGFARWRDRLVSMSKT